MKKTDIEFSNKEYNLLNEDLKYNIRFKKKEWIKNLALETENTLKFVYV
jgi:hypothetical protein